MAAHLDETQLMRLLEAAPQKAPRFWRQAAKTNPQDFGHLLECNQCLADLWDCFESRQTLAEPVKSSTATLSLLMTSVANAFSIAEASGLLWPGSMTPATAVRSAEQSEAAENLVAARYDLLVAELPGVLFSLEVKATAAAVHFVWQVSQTEPIVTTLSLHIDGQLQESHSISTKEPGAIMVVSVEAKTELQFLSGSTSGEHEVLRVSL